MKIVGAVLLMLVAVVGCSQTATTTGRTLVVQWEAPALGEIPPAEVSYVVAIQPYPSGTVTVLGTVVVLEYTITFATEGKYRIGVIARRMIAGDPSVVLDSAYLWSDDQGPTDSWYAVFYAAPDRVRRIRVKP